MNEEIRDIEILVYGREGVRIFEKGVQVEERNLLAILEGIEELQIITESTAHGELVVSIAGEEQSGTYFWLYYVNGEFANVGVGQYRVEDNDRIEFRLESFE